MRSLKAALTVQNTVGAAQAASKDSAAGLRTARPAGTSTAGPRQPGAMPRTASPGVRHVTPVSKEAHGAEHGRCVISNIDESGHESRGVNGHAFAAVSHAEGTQRTNTICMCGSAGPCDLLTFADRHDDACAVSTWRPRVARIHAQHVEHVSEVEPDGAHRHLLGRKLQYTSAGEAQAYQYAAMAILQ